MEQEIKRRTKQIGIDIVLLLDTLPQKQSAWILAKQLAEVQLR